MERLGSEVRVNIIGLSDIAVFFAIFEMDPIQYAADREFFPSENLLIG